MPLIEWEASYSVNHPEMDAQHKEWIAIYNRLHQAVLLADGRQPRERTSAALEEMTAYVDHHFAAEEQIMKNIDFSDFSRHRRMHDDFKGRLYRYCRDLEEHRAVINTEILGAIRTWLLEHILSEDKKYGQVDSSSAS
jgi:hemerythrin